MTRKTILLTLAALLAALGLACFKDDSPPPTPSPAPTAEPTITFTPGPTATPRMTSELVTEAAFPAVMAFAPDGRLFYNELKEANVRVIDTDGTLLPDPFATVEVADGDEWGLLGLAFDPDYETNHYVYILYTARDGELAKPTIMRYRDENNVGVEATVLAEFPTTPPDTYPYHVSGNIHFGPDGDMYVSLGNYTVPANSQDLTVPMGSILRLDREGNPAPGNPDFGVADADPDIYAWGIRNSFDFAFNPATGGLYATENGHTNCDELNLIEPGENYGWPMSYDEFAEECSNAGEHEPLYYFSRPSMSSTNSTVAPTGIEFVSGEAYPALGDSLLVCEYNTGRMIAYTLSGPEQDVVTPGDVLVTDCQLDIAIAPDGTVYYSNLEEIRRIVSE